MNDEGVCKTAPATPGLLITHWLMIFQNYLKLHIWIKICEKIKLEAGREIHSAKKWS